MTPQELKNSILQLAIQGRLVEQRPEEGTAEELYLQIQREKAALVKAGKIKKEKSLPEITEEEVPFEIPEGWKWVRIGEFASVLGGKRIPVGRKLSTTNTGHIYIRVSDMKDGSVTKDGLLYVPDDVFPSISKYVINKEDVYITVAGTIGRVGKIPPDLDGANLTENADRLVFSTIDQDWLIWCLQSSLIQGQIADATTKVGQPKLAIKRIQEMIIALPPLAEQKRIVAKIEELLPYIDRYEKAWSRLEDFNKRFPTDMQKSILQLAIQGKLVPQRPEEGTGEALCQQIQAEKQSLIRFGKLKKEEPLPDFSDDEIPFDIPESWRWVRFGFFSDIICTGLVRSSKEQYAKADYYYFKMNNIGNFDGKCHFENMNMIFATDEEYKRYRIEKGDFLFNTRNSRELVGKVAVVPAINDRIILNNNILKIHFYGGILPEYMCAFFVSQLGRIQLNQFITNTTNVAAIYQKQLVTLKVPLPPLAEQKRIVAKLEELLPLCDRLK